MAKLLEAERFWSKVVKNPHGCWAFTGTRRADGYRQFGAGSRLTGDRRNELAHRYVYKISVGPIPTDMTVDHECHNTDVSCLGGLTCPHRSCVRPDHLVLRSSVENQRRGRATSAQYAARTHCDDGHPYDEANTRVTARGRICRVCDRKKVAQRRKANPDRTREINRRADARRAAKRREARG